MKRWYFLISLMVLIFLFLTTGCMNLNTTDVNSNDISESDFSGAENYLPSFIELSDREYKNDELVVGYEKNAELDDVKEIILENFKGVEEIKDIPQLNAALLKLDTDIMDVEKAFEILKGKKIDGIRYVEPNYTDREIPVIKNTDSKVQKETESSVLNEVEEGYPDYRKFQYALDKIDAETAWEKATGEGVIVGLLDSGTDGTHPDLAGQLVEGYDPYLGITIDPTSDSSTDGHGTHTAGIIAAKDDDQGVVGLAPDAKIMPIRIFNPYYVGDYAVAAGIVWAVDHGADVLSNSWGGGGYSNVLKDAFDYALTHNVVVVASAGNDTTDQFWHYPSAYTGVIGVAASDANDEITYFSSRGEYVSVAAPGNNVISSIPVRLAGSGGVEGEPYAYWAGTSMACPYVSALAALIKEEYPDANVYQIRKMIEEGAVDIEEEEYDTAAGYGRISSKSLDLDPTDYEAGALLFKAQSKRNSWELEGVPITLINEETGKKYYGRTRALDVYSSEEWFIGIEPGKYTIIMGGPEIFQYRVNKKEEQLSYERKITVNRFSEKGITEYTQEYASTQFAITLWTYDTFDGTITFKLQSDGPVCDTFILTQQESEISRDLLSAIDKTIEETGGGFSPDYTLTYEYSTDSGQVGYIYVEGEVYLNHYDPIPVEFSIMPDSTTGYVTGGGWGSWAIF